MTFVTAILDVIAMLALIYIVFTLFFAAMVLISIPWKDITWDTWYIVLNWPVFLFS